jgi:hypothetical protein
METAAVQISDIDEMPQVGKSPATFKARAKKGTNTKLTKDLVWLVRMIFKTKLGFSLSLPFRMPTARMQLE